MELNSFKRRNELGVAIEYTIIGTFNDNDRSYMLYTDFVPEENTVGFRIFVDEILSDQSTVRLDKESADNVVNKFNEELVKFAVGE